MTKEIQISDFLENKYKSCVIFVDSRERKFRFGTSWQGWSGNRKHTYVF